ncbi:hypothetical protein [Streptomyces dubilierae]|uniref:Uncharacterized protein n=1 Tax=Streptomyces dubilierae TaxID=3075533 RepID=A0ABU2P847_9ACTN|nr:hypothetical protein [Streptomyces sp. DSM 41921]MDT0387814.1 hypothetical protein [Streptomyces sp. DSM 41921]
MSEQQSPSVGRIVHYVDWQEYGDGPRPGPCRAAIITNVIEPDKADAYVDLTIFEPNGWRVDGAVKNDESHTLGESWHWPERT